MAVVTVGSRLLPATHGEWDTTDPARSHLYPPGRNLDAAGRLAPRGGAEPPSPPMAPGQTVTMTGTIIGRCRVRSPTSFPNAFRATLLRLS